MVGDINSGKFDIVITGVDVNRSKKKTPFSFFIYIIRLFNGCNTISWGYDLEFDAHLSIVSWVTLMNQIQTEKCTNGMFDGNDSGVFARYFRGFR